MNSRTASKTEEVREEREDSTLAWREWILVMVGEKSMSTLTKSSIDNACTDTGEETKKAKIKNPSRNLDKSIFLKCFCIIGYLYCITIV